MPAEVTDALPCRGTNWGNACEPADATCVGVTPTMYVDSNDDMDTGVFAGNANTGEDMATIIMQAMGSHCIDLNNVYIIRWNVTNCQHYNSGLSREKHKQTSLTYRVSNKEILNLLGRVFGTAGLEEGVGDRKWSQRVGLFGSCSARTDVRGN